MFRFAGRPLLALLLCSALCPAAAASSPLPANRAAERAERFGKLGCAASAGARSPVRGVSDERGFDVEHYDLAIEVRDGSIAGTVRIDGRSAVEALMDVNLDLHDVYALGAVTGTHGIASTTRADHLLRVTLASVVANGQTFSVTVSYSGVPPGVGGPVMQPPFTFDTHGDVSAGTLAPVVYTLSVPWRSGAWWPTKETLSDRATIDLHITVADTLVAASNGVLASVEDLGDGRHTYHWSHGHPIAPYLVSLAISDYVLVEDSVSLAPPGPRGAVSVPIQYYVFPEKLEAAAADFERIPEAIQLYSDLYGLYPFADEKFAMALVPWAGGMEHQTCVTLGSRFVRGDKFYEWVFVHELAHQWWGDEITLSDWRDVWLNEGFATYSEAIWVEHAVGTTDGPDAGKQAYHLYMSVLDPFPPPRGEGFFGRIYDPSPLYGAAPYDKGAWVLHMLRHVVGESLFFGTDAASPDPRERGILRTYVERYSGRHVTTDAFREVAEELSDLDLAAFFDQWIFVEKRPSYRVSWTGGESGSGHTVVVDVRQTQPHLERYEMPIEIEIELEDAPPVRFTVMNTERSQSYAFDVSARPTGVTLDPDRWVLRNDPVDVDLAEPFVPMLVRNPARGVAEISFVLAKGSDVMVRLFDGFGRRVRTLVSGTRAADRHTVTWDGRDRSGKRLGSGVYFVELITPGVRHTTRFAFVR